MATYIIPVDQYKNSDYLGRTVYYVPAEKFSVLDKQKALTKKPDSNPVVRNLSVISTEALVRNLNFSLK